MRANQLAEVILFNLVNEANLTVTDIEINAIRREYNGYED